MAIRRAPIGVLLLVSCVLLGDDCDKDRDALRESRARQEAAEEMGGVSVDTDACLLLPGPMPAGLSAVPDADERLLVANSTPPAVVPVSVATDPPSIPSPVPSFPADSDGDGVDDILLPVLDGVFGLAPDLALVTSQVNEQVIFVDAATGNLVQGTVGTETRTALSTAVVVAFPEDALDSTGAAAADPGATSFTSGAAVSEGLLFVSTANGFWTLGDPVYQPGTVLIFDFDLSSGVPSTSGDDPQVIFTTGYNPSHVTAYTSPGERHFVLVTTSGAVALAGTRLDFAASATDAARAGYVEVIEIFPEADPALDPARVAVIPLGAGAPAFEEVAVDPSGRVGATGSLIAVPGGQRGVKERRVLAMNLGVLDSLPAEPPETPPLLDGSDANPDATIDDPSLEIEAIAGGPTALACSGTVTTTAWTPDGRLLAAELCDGTLSSWSVDAGATPPAFSLREEIAMVAPFLTSASEPSTPVDLVVRNGTGFTGPDVYLLLGSPDGFLCGIASGAL